MLIQNALTIDVEDYYQVSGFERDIRRGDWHAFPSRVVASTRRILAMLEETGIQATFFVLGWVAEREPGLIREIDQAGHEIGSHSYWHRLVYELLPEEFRSDLRRSRDVLQNIIAKPVTAYRAPSFSITARSLWALDILAEEGFEVDSSVFPVRHHRYGIPGAGTEPYLHECRTGSLWEFPMTVARVAGISLPVSGGGYFRLYPYRFTSRLLRHENQSNRPFVFYLHPWEIDPQQPRLMHSSRWTRLRHYVNLHSTEAKFRQLLGEFSFTRLDVVLSAYQAALQPLASSPLSPELGLGSELWEPVRITG